MSQSFVVRKAAVLGAGVMGAQIAAHLVNANVEVVLFDLPAKEGDRNGIVQKAIANLLKLEPSPLSAKSKSSNIIAANYQDNLDLLKDCNLIIEAIAERLEWKSDLYAKVAPFLAPDAVFATNTSGLSINKLASFMPEKLRPRFCGIHFFNPPRYMNLVELIPCEKTDMRMVDDLETFVVSALGKGVIRAKDTPNFISNRVGVFGILSTILEAEKFGLSFDVVDALTGPIIGRPKSASFRTMDVVGLDTFGHVVSTMTDGLQSDPWHHCYKTPAWLKMLTDKGALGQKTGAGIYKKVGKEIHVLDLELKDYRLSQQVIAPEVESILKIKFPAEKFAALRASTHPQAQFVWSIFRDMFQYCAVHLESIANNARDIDFAIRWGFGWAVGPFETWQMAGWNQIAMAVSEDIAAGKSLCNTPLPAWVSEATANIGVHAAYGSYSPRSKSFESRSTLPVYERQPYPERLVTDAPSYGKIVFENSGGKLWTTGDGIAVLSFKSKMHAVGDDVLDAVIESVRIAEQKFKGLVIWQTEAPFSAGANLAHVAPLLERGEFDKGEAMVKKFQDASMALKYSMVPTIAAVNGMALGGGCEFVMHCTKAVAHLESYIGLVEVGVGLLPAGGGCKEFAIRSARKAEGGNAFAFLQSAFTNIAMGNVSKSAEHARELGFLKPSDTIVLNGFETLYVAKSEVLNLFQAGYRPNLRVREIPVAGKGGIATLKMILINMKEGGFISEHDFEIGCRIATVMCGGDVEGGTLVSEDWLLELERREFMALMRNPKTQARIDFMLKNGKPLRN